jgi:hypothetical protein
MPVGSCELDARSGGDYADRSVEAPIGPGPADRRVAVCARSNNDRAGDTCLYVRIFRPHLHLRSRGRPRYVPDAPHADRLDPVPTARNPGRFGRVRVVARTGNAADDLHCGRPGGRSAAFDSLFLAAAGGLDRPARTASTPQLAPASLNRQRTHRSEVHIRRV